MIARYRLVLADVPSALWFSYVYLHNTGTGHIVAQRVKFETFETKFEKLAHLTNYIFNEGYLAPKLRASVYWEGVCGKRVDENALVNDLLCSGEGISEDQPLRLVIGRFLSDLGFSVFPFWFLTSVPMFR